MGIKEAIAIVAEIQKEAKERRHKKELPDSEYIFTVRKPGDSENDKRKIKGKDNRFPYDDEHNASRAVGIVRGLTEVPWWFEGTLPEMITTVEHAVSNRYDLDLGEIKPIKAKKHATPERPVTP